MADILTAAEAASRWPAFASLPADRQSTLIGDATAIIATEAGLAIGAANYVEKLDGAGWPALRLAHKPVISVASVSVNGTAVDNTDGDEWLVDAERGELIRGDGYAWHWWPRGRMNIEVAYRAGFEMIPDRVKRAAVLVMQHLEGLATSPAVSGLYKSVSLGDLSYTMADTSSRGTTSSIPEAAWALLSPYTDRRFDVV